MKSAAGERIWGRRETGEPFATGMTVEALIALLRLRDPGEEICMVIAPWVGVLGKLQTIESGVPGQVWLMGMVLDETLLPLSVKTAPGGRKEREC